MSKHREPQPWGVNLRRWLLSLLCILFMGGALPVSTAPTTVPIRLPAEYEQTQALVLAWPVGIVDLYPLYVAIVRASVAEVPVVLVVPTQAAAGRVRDTLAAEARPALRRVHFLVAPTRSVWIRDYGPLYVVGGGAAPVAVDARYSPRRLPAMDLEDEIPVLVAAFTNSAVRQTPLVLDGGNLVSDGDGRCFTSTVVLTQNPGYSRVQIAHELRSTFGCDEVEILFYR